MIQYIEMIEMFIVCVIDLGRDNLDFIFRQNWLFNQLKQLSEAREELE